MYIRSNILMKFNIFAQVSKQYKNFTIDIKNHTFWKRLHWYEYFRNLGLLQINYTGCLQNKKNRDGCINIKCFLFCLNSNRKIIYYYIKTKTKDKYQLGIMNEKLQERSIFSFQKVYFYTFLDQISPWPIKWSPSIYVYLIVLNGIKWKIHYERPKSYEHPVSVYISFKWGWFNSEWIRMDTLHLCILYWIK